MLDDPQRHPAETGARQPRSGLTMTWVPQRDARGRTYLAAHWAPAAAVSTRATSAPRSAA